MPNIVVWVPGTAPVASVMISIKGAHKTKTSAGTSGGVPSKCTCQSAPWHLVDTPYRLHG